MYIVDKLPVGITRKIYEYDSTFKIEFDKVLKQLRCHFFLYNCHLCYRKWNDCFCYCKVCKTYLRFCKQLYFDENSMEEDMLENAIAIN